MSVLRFLIQDQCDSEASTRQIVIALGKAILVVRHRATFLFRLAQVFGRRAPALAYLVKQLNHTSTGADLAWEARVGSGLRLFHPTGVVWGKGVSIGTDCRIQQGVTLGGRGGSGDDGSPEIGDAVELGAGSRVIGPVKVGDGTIIGANAVVLSDVPPLSIAVGVPAKVVRSRG